MKRVFLLCIYYKIFIENNLCEVVYFLLRENMFYIELNFYIFIILINISGHIYRLIIS